MFRFHFKARWSHFTSLLGLIFYFLAWPAMQRSLYVYKLSPRLLKHVRLWRENTKAAAKYVTLVTLKLLHFTPYLRLASHCKTERIIDLHWFHFLLDLVVHG